MRLKVKITGLLLAAAGLGSSCRDKTCSEPAMVEPCTADSALVNIRVRNISSSGFCGVYLNPGSETVYYGSVGEGEVSCYRSFAGEAYAQPSVTLSVEEKKFIMQPVSLTGAVVLEKGKYTCDIDITDFGKGTLQVELSPD